MNTCRCSVCGRSNNPFVDPEQYTKGPFFDDPQPKYPWDKVCEECMASVNDYQQGYEEGEIDVYADADTIE